MVSLRLKVFVVSLKLKVFVVSLRLKVFVVSLKLKVFVVSLRLKVFVVSLKLKVYVVSLKLKVPPRWLTGRAFASHAGDRGSIPGRNRPTSLKQAVTDPLPNAWQLV